MHLVFLVYDARTAENLAEVRTVIVKELHCQIIIHARCLKLEFEQGKDEL